MKLTFEVNCEELDEIICRRLRQDYIDQLTVWKHEEYSKKLAKALLKVIEYYSIPTEYQQWRESVKE